MAKTEMRPKPFLILNCVCVSVCVRVFVFQRQTQWFHVIQWNCKLYIFAHHIKYLSTPLKSLRVKGKNKNFEIFTSILFSPSAQCLAFMMKLTEIFENMKGFGWVNIEWLKLSGKNLKDLRGMQSHYINIFWTVPSYP